MPTANPEPAALHRTSGNASRTGVRSVRWALVPVALTLLLLAAFGVVAWYGLGRLNRSIEHDLSRQVAAVIAQVQLSQELDRVQGHLEELVSGGRTGPTWAGERQTLVVRLNGLRHDLAELRQRLPNTAQAKAIAQVSEASLQAYFDTAGHALAALDEGQDATPPSLAARGLMRTADADLRRIEQVAATALSRSHQDQVVTYRQALWLLLTTGVSLWAALVAGWAWGTHHLARRADRVVQAAMVLARNPQDPPDLQDLAEEARSGRDLLSDLAGAVLAFRDAVVQRQQSQLALLRERSVLEAMMRHSPDLIWLKDLDGRYLYGYRRFEALLGLDRDCIVGRRDVEIAKADLAATLLRLEQAFTTTSPRQDQEVWLDFPEGHRELVHVIKAPVHDGTGATIGVLGVARDITERVAHAERLQQSQAELLRAQQVARMGSWSLHLPSEALDGSHQMREIFGWSAEQALCLQDVRDALTAEDLRQLDHHWRRALKGAPLDLVVPMQIRGEPRWMELRAELERTSDGWVTGAVGTVRDVTDTHQAARALERRERIYQAIVAQSPLAVMLVEPATLRLVEFNAAACGTLGHDREFMAACTLNDLQLELNADELRARVTQALAHGHHDFETCLRGAHGQCCEAWVTLRSLELDGDPYLSVMWADIRERKEQQRELLQYQNELERRVVARTAQLVAARHEAEGAHRAKSAFLANMSHEIRTPMHAIIGLSHLLLRSGLAEPQRDLVSRQQSAAQALLQMVNDVLDLSRIDAGAMALQDAVFEPARVLQQALDRVRDRSEAKGLEVTAQLDVLPPRLRGDGIRFGQVVLNLLLNAVKFTDRGTVTLRARLRSGPDRSQVWMRTEVADTGIGLSPEQQTRLFQPFEQLDNSTTRRFGGTGLGLATARQLAQAMGGEVGVVSAQGQGSTFWVEVPFHAGDALPVHPSSFIEDESTASDAESRLLARPAGHLVLVVDDDPVSREQVQAMLERVGMMPHLVRSRGEALSMVRHEVPDLVLMDHDEPGAGGHATALLLRSVPGLAKVPVVGMSCGGRLEDAAPGHSSGQVETLSKPLEEQALYRALLRWLPAWPGRARSDSNRHESAGEGLSAHADSGGTPNPPFHPGLPIQQAPSGTALLPLPVAGVGVDLWRGLGEAVDGSPETGLRHCGGDADIYRRMLRRFLEHHLDDPGRLRAASSRGDLATLRLSVHSIKGVAGTLGFSRLRVLAEQLESELPAAGLPGEFRDPEFVVAAEAAQLATVLQGTLDRLAHWLTTEPAPADESLAGSVPGPVNGSTPQGGPSVTAATVARIGHWHALLRADALEAGQMDRVLFGDLSRLLGSDTAETLQRLAQRYDYGQAAQLLAQDWARKHPDRLLP